MSPAICVLLHVSVIVVFLKSFEKKNRFQLIFVAEYVLKQNRHTLMDTDSSYYNI